MNVMSAVRVGSRKIMRSMMEYVDGDLGGPMSFDEWFQTTEDCEALKKE